MVSNFHCIFLKLLPPCAFYLTQSLYYAVCIIEWAHIACALLLPETNFGDSEKVEPVLQINLVDPLRWKLNCNICQLPEAGACMQCAYPRCRESMHVLCAYSKRRVKLFIQGKSTEVKLSVFCARHVDLVSEDGVRITEEKGSSGEGDVEAVSPRVSQKPSNKPGLV